jgi:hypothetical protein
LSLSEAIQSGAFDSADVHEDILATVIGLDKAEALLAVEPLYSSLRSRSFSLQRWISGWPLQREHLPIENFKS